MTEKNLTKELKKLALETGAELVGISSAEKLEQESLPGHRPSDLLKTSRSVILLACGRSLNEDRDYVYNWGPGYSLTFISLKDETKWRRKQAKRSIYAVQDFLQQRGFHTVIESHGWTGVLSFKLAAYLGGLGVLGKGNFIVNPKLGPLNVLACILTDAQLEYGEPLNVDVCKDCIECIKACKYGAFKKDGDSYIWIGEKCRCYDLIMNPVTLKWTYGPCNSKCVHACPVGK
jgi:epoxyqueuosine reductase QueG